LLYQHQPVAPVVRAVYWHLQVLLYLHYQPVGFVAACYPVSVLLQTVEHEKEQWGPAPRVLLPWPVNPARVYLAVRQVVLFPWSVYPELICRVAWQVVLRLWPVYPERICRVVQQVLL
jgi:hypothetical protein